MTGDHREAGPEKKVIHLDEAERLPAVPNPSQGAEVVKQIIEQILANERRRARLEFIQISVFFLVCLAAIMGTGIWFARQLLAQLHDERVLTEQVWQMAGGRIQGGGGVVPPAGPVLNGAEVARLEKNIQTVSNLLKTNPGESQAAIRDMLKSQDAAIKAMSVRLNEAQDRIAASAAGENVIPPGNGQVDFVTAPVAEDLQLRMPIP